MDEIGETLQETLSFEGEEVSDRLASGLSTLLSLPNSDRILVKHITGISLRPDAGFGLMHVRGELFDPTRHRLRSPAGHARVTVDLYDERAGQYNATVHVEFV